MKQNLNIKIPELAKTQINYKEKERMPFLREFRLKRLLFEKCNKFFLGCCLGWVDCVYSSATEFYVLEYKGL